MICHRCRRGCEDWLRVFKGKLHWVPILGLWHEVLQGSRPWVASRARCAWLDEAERALAEMPGDVGLHYADTCEANAQAWKEWGERA